MSANANNYSVGGAAELTINVATGTSTSVSSNPVVSTFTGNGVSGLIFGEGTDAAQTGLTSAPDLINAGIGTVTTYGRNSTTITALNIARTGGAPQALSSASSGVSWFSGKCQQRVQPWDERGVPMGRRLRHHRCRSHRMFDSEGVLGMASTEAVGQQVKSGFRTAGAWLLGFALLCLVFGGIIIGFSPSEYPPIFGWVLLAAAAAILVLTADFWVKAFPGIMAVATINSLLTLSSGHATGNPSVLIPRTTAILATLLLAAGTALSMTFRRKVSAPDRAALLALAVSIGWGAVDVRHWLPALAVGTCCLLLAWVYDRSRRSPVR